MNMETPVLIRLDCSEPECNKNFVNKRNLTTHMKRFHMIVNAVSNSPIVNTVRTLFSAENGHDIQTPSTQGASDGSINSPKVTSVGLFQCDECTYEVEIKDELMKHKIEKHDKAYTAGSVNNDDSLDGEEIVHLMEMEDMTTAKDVANREAEEKIVNSFVENAFKVINHEEEEDNTKCHNCDLKEEVITDKDSMLDTKETMIAEKTATVNGLMQRVKKLEEEKAVLKKKVEQTDKLKETLSTRNKEISNLKVDIHTKDQLLAHAIKTTEADKHTEVIVDAALKKCKKCKFTAPNMNVLGLHMENDHQYEFECTECSNKFPFKNQLKIHRREVHEEGTFSCFVCNNRFKTHKELKQHIQKKCKSQNTANQTTVVNKQIVHKHNEDILEEDEHKCTMCSKITNNQVSLIHHINTAHMPKKDKCDSCGQEFENKSTLIEHIVEKHTVKGTQIIQRHVCKVCNVEVHGEESKNNHMCRKHMDACSFCKKKFYSREAMQEHICSMHPFKSVDDQLLANKRKTVECNHGVDCYRARRGRCWFKHSLPVNMIPHGVQGQLQQGEQQGQVQQQGHLQGRVQQQVQQQGHPQGRVQQQGHHQGQVQQQQQVQQQGHSQAQWQGQQQDQGEQGQGQWHQQKGRRRGQANNSTRSQQYCRYQETCFKGPQACNFKHIQQNFLQVNQSQNPQ